LLSAYYAGMLGLTNTLAGEGTAMTLVCTACDDEVEDEDYWDEESKMCLGCFEVSGSPTYCCGIMYDEGEDTCKSCGEPL
jgi:hypothetical protein